MGDDYIDIDAKVLAIREKAVMLETDEGKGWMPRSCMHASSDIVLNNMSVGEETTFRVREWKAVDMGLV